MLPYNVDSISYGEMLRDVAREISARSARDIEMFKGIQAQLENILVQLEDWESQRTEFADIIQMDDYDHPETLDDFDTAPDSTVDDLYAAWEEFAAAEGYFNEDSIYIDELRIQIENAISQIGVE